MKRELKAEAIGAVGSERGSISLRSEFIRNRKRNQSKGKGREEQWGLRVVAVG